MAAMPIERDNPENILVLYKRIVLLLKPVFVLDGADLPNSFFEGSQNHTTYHPSCREPFRRNRG